MKDILETDLLSAHKIPMLETSLQAVNCQRARGVRLYPSCPQGTQAIGIFDFITQEVSACILVELEYVEIRCLFALYKLVNSNDGSTLFWRAV